MKVFDYQVSKIIDKLILRINFNAIYSHLASLSHPEMPTADIEDLKVEARALLKKTFDDVIKTSGNCYNHSANFKATFINDEMHLDVILDWSITEICDLVDKINGA